MKKKYLLLSVGLLGLTLTGCESKVADEKAEDLINDATEKTMNKVAEIKNYDVLGLSAKVEGGFSLKLSANDEEMEIAVSGGAEISANVDVKGILAADENTNIDDLENSLFAKYNVESNEMSGETLSDGGSVKVEDNTYTLYDKNNTAGETGVAFTYDDILEIKDLINGNFDSDISDVPLPDISTSLPDISTMVPSQATDLVSVLFAISDLSRDEAIATLESYFEVSDMPELKPHAGAIYDCVTEFSNQDYVSYTKSSSKGNTIYTMSLEYEKIIEELGNALNDLKTEIVSNPQLLVVVSTLQSYIDIYAPKKAEVKVSISVSKDGIINGVSASLSANGEISIAGTKMGYEISANVASEFSFGNTKVVIN